MNDAVIKVENLSKQYRLGQVSSGTISHDLNRWWYKMRGKEDPFLKVGEANERSQKGESDYVWSLKDINFDIEQGSAVGIIGKNGAGKSTLLKILSKVTGPTTGSIKVKGRIASLLEVGTGFHPELTGRENIYLNGAILGMKKSEINKKFDEIVDFSGVERYIDTPVKRYSSGMYVRLAFAVAAHLESEILIVDEVLAVGDAEFQSKCLGKMGDVSKGEGRTVLFVSHNMASVKALCDKGILLSKGSIEAIDNIDLIVAAYLNEYLESSLNQTIERSVIRTGNRQLLFDMVALKDLQGNKLDYVMCGQDFNLELLFTTQKNVPFRSLHFSINIKDNENRSIAHMSNTVSDGLEYNQITHPMQGKVVCKVRNFNIQPGTYIVEIYCASYHEPLDWIIAAGKLQVETGSFYKTELLPPHGLCLIQNNWDFQLL